jgi:hypothetical protein
MQPNEVADEMAVEMSSLGRLQRLRAAIGLQICRVGFRILPKPISDITMGVVNDA